MNRDELMETLFPGGRTAGKRGTESYIRKCVLWDEFIEATNGFIDSPTLKDRIIILKYGDVKRCLVCGKHIGQEATYCHEHRFEGRKGKPAHNRSVQDEQRIVEAYESGMSSLEISNQEWCSCSHVTVMKILKRNGVNLLSQSEILLRKREEIPEKEIIEYYKTSNLYRTAHVFNVPVYRVRELVNENRLSHSEACQHNFPDYTEESKEWNKQYLEGKRVKDIAEENNLPYSTVSRYIEFQPRDKLAGKQLCGRKVDFSGLEELYKTMTLSELARHYNCNEWTVRVKLHALGITKPKDTFTEPEHIISVILEKHNIPYKIHDRTIIKPKELDIWIPEHNLAIELNGLYWHSGNKPDNRHMNKFLDCEAIGIRLLQFTDYDTGKRADMVESIILDTLRLQPHKINVNECEIVKLDNPEHFFNENHYIGYTKANNAVGLQFNGEIVMALSYSSNHIIQYASKLFHNVEGGFRRLEEFISELYNYKTLESSAVALVDNGTILKENGFINRGFIEAPELYQINGNRKYSGAGIIKFEKGNQT